MQNIFTINEIQFENTKTVECLLNILHNFGKCASDFPFERILISRKHVCFSAQNGRVWCYDLTKWWTSCSVMCNRYFHQDRVEPDTPVLI